MWYAIACEKFPSDWCAFPSVVRIAPACFLIRTRLAGFQAQRDKLLLYYTDLYPTELNHNQQLANPNTLLLMTSTVPNLTRNEIVPFGSSHLSSKSCGK